jgi:UDP-glucose 4-epimerase
MRILVTGGSGFVGSHTVDALIARGHEPCIFDLVAPTAQPPQRVDSAIGDILDAAAVRRAVQGCDAVIHLAAVADVNHVMRDPARARRVNVRGTRHVLGAAAAEGIRRVVFASTVWVYGSSNGRPFTEDDEPAAAGHPYVATKLAGERLCTEYARRGLGVTVARLGIPYGPRARAATVLARFASQAIRGEPITVAGDGRQSRPFVYVEDLADGIAAAASAAQDGTYNLSPAGSVSILTLADTVRALINPATRIVHTDRRAGDIDRLHVSSERAACELGWRPRVALPEGIMRYIAWLTETNGKPAAAPDSKMDGRAAAVTLHEPGAL